jgi:hypothetical protein
MSSAAWGALAHAVIGHLAENQLLRDDAGLTALLRQFRQPAQRHKIKRALLGLTPPAPGRALRVLANWPDVNKRRDGMLPYDGLRHFVNLPLRARYQRMRHCADGVCSIETLLQQRAILGDRRRALSTRAVALAWVVHLVGDIHQPLHAGKASDRGGNLTCVTWQQQPSTLITVAGEKQCSGTNLHAVWDSQIIRQITGFSHPSDAAAYARQLRRFVSTVHIEMPPLNASTPAEWRTTIERWHGETQALILSHDIYPPGNRIDQAYMQAHYPIIRRQLLRAAVRLAALLRRTLNR